MTQDEVLSILSPCFHAAFLDVCKNRVYVGESIFYAAGLTANRDSVFSPEWGFMILLDERFVEVAWADYVSAIGTSYFRVGSGKSKTDRRWLNSDRFGKDFFLAPSTAASKHKDVLIRDVRFEKIAGITRNDYEVKDEIEGSIPLVELRFEFKTGYGTSYKVFKSQDGERVLSLLTAATRNGNKLSPDPAMTSADGASLEILRLIEALNDLRKVGVLTEPEFDQKKQLLLLRL
jgi:hypothetical protein